LAICTTAPRLKLSLSHLVGDGSHFQWAFFNRGLGVRAFYNRRFPPTWSVDERGAAFAVCDANGQALAYVYFEEEPGRRSAAKLLTKDEARRIVAHTAKSAELLTRAIAPRIASFHDARLSWLKE
jgi:hypothetical protein